MRYDRCFKIVFLPVGVVHRAGKSVTQEKTAQVSFRQFANSSVLAHSIYSLA